MNDSPPKKPGQMPDSDLAPRHQARLDALIGTKLRSYYEELMAEPVPNRILDLLAQLEAKEREDGDQDESAEKK